ncbi:SagB/ThcOx family dehydrogenase [Streptomyces sp. NPDC007920]|uniref:SagB/ThcOx family dehydrogenase n=1 Tax=Streptomyces sp. NPDC007920 TaxID=3364794 RepID=UPI0036EA4441
MAENAATDLHESMAFAFHKLSSFGYFDEPVPTTAGPAIGELPSRHHQLAGDEVESLARLLRSRVSQRSFTGGPVPEDVLRLLLWCAYGRTIETPAEQRTVPSAGGLYPLRLIVATRDVSSLSGGLYEFSSDTAELLPLAGDGFDANSVGELFRTRHVPFDRTAVVVFFCARVERSLSQYGERGYRYALMEAGHASQNLCLAATALRIGHVPLGGFDDDALGRLLSRYGVNDTALYAMAIGNAGAQADDPARSAEARRTLDAALGRPCIGGGPA